LQSKAENAHRKEIAVEGDLILESLRQIIFGRLFEQGSFSGNRNTAEKVKYTVCFEFLKKLREAAVPARLGGSFAAAHYGAPRVPQDVDLDLLDLTAINKLHSLIAGLVGRPMVIENVEFRVLEFIPNLDIEAEKQAIYEEYSGRNIHKPLTAHDFTRLEERLCDADIAAMRAELQSVDDIKNYTVAGDLDYEYKTQDGKKMRGHISVDAQCNENSDFRGKDELLVPSNDCSKNSNIVHPLYLVSRYLRRIKHYPEEAGRKGDDEQIVGIVNKMLNNSSGSTLNEVKTQLSKWVAEKNREEYEKRLDQIMASS